MLTRDAGAPASVGTAVAFVVFPLTGTEGVLVLAGALETAATGAVDTSLLGVFLRSPKIAEAPSAAVAAKTILFCIGRKRVRVYFLDESSALSNRKPNWKVLTRAKTGGRLPRS